MAEWNIQFSELPNPNIPSSRQFQLSILDKSFTVTLVHIMAPHEVQPLVNWVETRVDYIVRSREGGRRHIMTYEADVQRKHPILTLCIDFNVLVVVYGVPPPDPKPIELENFVLDPRIMLIGATEEILLDHFGITANGPDISLFYKKKYKQRRMRARKTRKSLGMGSNKDMELRSVREATSSRHPISRERYSLKKDADTLYDNFLIDVSMGEEEGANFRKTILCRDLFGLSPLTIPDYHDTSRFRNLMDVSRPWVQVMASKVAWEFLMGEALGGSDSEDSDDDE